MYHLRVSNDNFKSVSSLCPFSNTIKITDNFNKNYSQYLYS